MKEECKFDVITKTRRWLTELTDEDLWTPPNGKMFIGKITEVKQNDDGRFNIRIRYLGIIIANPGEGAVVATVTEQFYKKLRGQKVTLMDEDVLFDPSKNKVILYKEE